MAAALALVLLAASAHPTRASAHPLHTSITEIVYDARAGVAEVTVRLFADDLARAVAHASISGARASETVSDGAAFLYLSRVLALATRDGRAAPLRWIGMRRTGDLVWLSVSAPLPGGLSGAAVQSRVLFDVYADQINIVQTLVGTHRESLLFIAGDSFERIP